MTEIPQWLKWARAIQALAQTSKTFAETEWQIERYEQLQKIAAEIIAEHTDLQFDEVLKNLNIQKGYATPKVDVRGVIFEDDKILLVYDKLGQGWCLPGGWSDVGDTPSEAVEREVWEESGLIVKAARLIGIYDTNRVGDLELHHAYKLLFFCENMGGRLRTSSETEKVGFFAKEEIPGPFAGERTRTRHIDDAFKFLDNPDLPTLFD